jgi:hypothetical protein
MDDVARDYLVLALSVGELEEGIVDSYYGPPELRDRAVSRGPTAPQLAQEARALRERVTRDVEDAQRRRWLDRQLVALETLARRIAGEELSYVEEVTRCFDAPPERTPSRVYAQVRRELDALLPGKGSVHERLEARDERLTIPADRLGPILEWLVGEIRSSSAAVFPAPDGETLTVSLVTDQPWSAYNWYDGGLRSRIEFNTDLPARAPTLISTIAHETFPGHHLEHAWKEQRLVREGGRAECSVQLINTPEAYVGEGLAEVGWRLIVSPERWQELLRGVCDRAGIAMTDAGAAREWTIAEVMRPLRGSGGDAALMFHADGRPLDEVRRFLVEVALASHKRADQNVRFIGHPLWRTYVFCYAGGERLLTNWCSAAGSMPAQRQRFFRLLTEQLTPSGIAEELAAA